MLVIGADGNANASCWVVKNPVYVVSGMKNYIVWLLATHTVLGIILAPSTHCLNDKQLRDIFNMIYVMWIGEVFVAIYGVFGIMLNEAFLAKVRHD